MSSPGSDPPPRSNRGFWVVLGTLIVLGVGTVVWIVLVTPPPRNPSEVDARASLRNALSAALAIRDTRGSFAVATPDELGVVEPSLAYLPGDRESVSAVSVSVHAEDGLFAAAARSADGTCYWIRDDGVEQTFGSGTPCTGDAALAASGARW